MWWTTNSVRRGEAWRAEFVTLLVIVSYLTAEQFIVGKTNTEPFAEFGVDSYPVKIEDWID
jgi:hypothetical protein